MANFLSEAQTRRHKGLFILPGMLGLLSHPHPSQKRDESQRQRRLALQPPPPKASQSTKGNEKRLSRKVELDKAEGLRINELLLFGDFDAIGALSPISYKTGT